MWSFIIYTPKSGETAGAYTKHKTDEIYATSILKVEKQRTIGRFSLKKRSFVPLKILILLNWLQQHSFGGTPKYENKLRRYLLRIIS